MLSETREQGFALRGISGDGATTNPSRSARLIVLLNEPM
jgi:hypothetical protein